MSEQFVKMIDDVKVYLDPEDGRFVAMIGGRRRRFETFHQVEKAIDRAPAYNAAGVRAFQMNGNQKPAEYRIGGVRKARGGSHAFVDADGNRIGLTWMGFYHWNEQLVTDLLDLAVAEDAIRVKRAALLDEHGRRVTIEDVKGKATSEV